jgi:hypothetical protein
MRVIGLDVHRSFAVTALLEDEQLRSGGRVELTRDAVVVFSGPAGGWSRCGACCTGTSWARPGSLPGLTHMVSQLKAALERGTSAYPRRRYRG